MADEAQVLRFSRKGVKAETVTAAGANPAPPPKQQLLQELDIIAGNLGVAQNRVTTLVDPNAKAAEVASLVERYGVLQSKVYKLSQKAKALSDKTSQDDALGVARDINAVGNESENYIQAVEKLISEAPRQQQPIAAVGVRGLGAATAADSKSNVAPYLVLGALAVVTAGGGYLLWKQKQAKDKASVTKSRRFTRALVAGKKK